MMLTTRSSGAPVSDAAGCPRRCAPRRPLNVRPHTTLLQLCPRFALHRFRLPTQDNWFECGEKASSTASGYGTSTLSRIRSSNKWEQQMQQMNKWGQHD